MERWMALDVGAKTIGVAVTDLLKITVRPLTTLQRSGLSRDVRQVEELIHEMKVVKLIVGKPLHLDGTPSSTQDLISPLVDCLKSVTSIPLVWSDERLSTKEAEDLMREIGLRMMQRRTRRNEFAAAVILRRHLEESRCH